jgi:hypothetical protein
VVISNSNCQQFWVVYTLEESDELITSSEIYVRLAEWSQLHVDAVEQQREMVVMAEFRNMGVNYEGDEMFSADFVENRLDFGYLSVQSSGSASSTAKRSFHLSTPDRQLESTRDWSLVRNQTRHPTRPVHHKW